jgi:deazaflavin-dependent oxidoreductase (nitroreductase family)
VSEFNDRNRSVIEEFRANHGRLGGPFEGGPMLLLTTTGARSGQRRVNPMMYLQEGDKLYVFASKGGAPTNPDWYHNLIAHPQVTVELGDETFQATATPVAGAERDRIYAEQSRRYPMFGEYQQKAKRTIPVVAIERLR